MLDKLALVEKWLPTWLKEPEKWLGAMEHREGGSTITSLWRPFGDGDLHVVLQIMHGAEPEQFETSDGRYVLRVCKGILEIKQGLELETVPGGVRAGPKYKIEMLNQAVLAAGSCFVSNDPDAYEYLRPLTDAGLASGETMLARVNRSSDECSYEEGQKMQPKNVAWVLKQFEPLYGPKGRWG